MIGIELAAALLLAAAGWGKLRRSRSPIPPRSPLTAAGLPGARLLPARRLNPVLGGAELLVAAGVIAFGGRLAGALLLIVFAGLALAAVRMIAVDRGQDCGCFGTPSPISHWHTAVNAGAAVAGLVGVIRPAPSWPHELADRPLVALALALAAIVLAYLGYLMMTALPDLLTRTAEVMA